MDLIDPSLLRCAFPKSPTPHQCKYTAGQAQKPEIQRPGGGRDQSDI